MYRMGAPPPGETHYCFYCGGALRGTDCGRCGARACPPWPFDRAPICPRCSRPLVAEMLGDLPIETCPSCRGNFLSRAEWDALLVRVHAREHVDFKLLVPVPPENPADLLHVATCPACGRAMDRCSFAIHSKTPIDTCPPHGIWLDDAELLAVITILTQRLMGMEVEADAGTRVTEGIADAVRAMADAILKRS